MVKTRTLFALVVAVVLTAGCTSSDRTPSGANALQRVDTILLQETDSLFIGDFQTVHVELEPFRMYVPDRIMHRIAVIDRAGTIIRTIGRRGEGPGEMDNPRAVTVMDDKVYVEARNYHPVFDTTGEFVRNYQLPEGYQRGGQGTIRSNGEYIFLPATDVNVREAGLRASAQDKAVVQLDSTFRMVKHFATFPLFYQTNEHVWRFRYVDISPSGNVAAVAYYLLPEVYLYDLSDPDPPLTGSIELTHPEFMMIDEEVDLSVSFQEMQEIAQQTSFTWGVWMPTDTTVVWQFNNRTEAFYENRSDEEMLFYATIGTTSGRILDQVKLPGPILARDDRGRLYIRHSNVPDEREIGIYEIRPSDEPSS